MFILLLCFAVLLIFEQGEHISWKSTIKFNCLWEVSYLDYKALSPRGLACLNPEPSLLPASCSFHLADGGCSSYSTFHSHPTSTPINVILCKAAVSLDSASVSPVARTPTFQRWEPAPPAGLSKEISAHGVLLPMQKDGER